MGVQIDRVLKKYTRHTIGHVQKQVSESARFRTWRRIIYPRPPLAGQAMPTTKQQRFIDEYLIDFNATQAAIRAGYSQDTAKQQGSRLLSNVDVRAAIDTAIRERSSRALLSQDAVLCGLLEEARYTGEGSSHSARVSAWAHIGKHLGMFIDRVHATGQQAHGITHIQLVAPDLDEHGMAKKAAKDMTDAEIDAELMKLESTTAMLN